MFCDAVMANCDPTEEATEVVATTTTTTTEAFELQAVAVEVEYVMDDIAGFLEKSPEERKESLTESFATATGLDAEQIDVPEMTADGDTLEVEFLVTSYSASERSKLFLNLETEDFQKVLGGAFETAAGAFGLDITVFYKATTTAAPGRRMSGTVQRPAGVMTTTVPRRLVDTCAEPVRLCAAAKMRTSSMFAEFEAAQHKACACLPMSL